MNDETPDSPATSVWIMLTKIDGKLDTVVTQVGSIDRTVERHAEDIGILKSTTQRLDEQASARDAKALALATALKEAEEQRRTKSDTAWSPFTKLFAVVAVLGALWGIFGPMLAK